jgi:hypothetical protein
MLALPDIDARLRPLGDPAIAAQTRSYLKSSRTHLGVKVPEVRRVAREVHPEADRAPIDALWATDVFEHALLATELLRLRAPRLDPLRGPRRPLPRGPAWPAGPLRGPAAPARALRSGWRGTQLASR